jgi:BirA family biotin operon repressor/biotin-[acetyl-CoA-carboxylase] ligase
MKYQPLNQKIFYRQIKKEPFKYFHDFIYHDTLESTNTTGKEYVISEINHGAVIVAKTQTKGRGRYSRTWFSPPGGLYLSLVFQTKIPQKLFSIFPLLTANSVHLLLKKHSIPSTIKWPNDILVKQKKIAGILIECIQDTNQNHCLICGIGLNVNNHHESLPGNLLNPATSIIDEIGHKTNILNLIIQFIHTFEEQYEKLYEKKVDEVIDLWKKASDTLGKQIIIKQNNSTICGIAEDIDKDGFLILRTKSNNIKRITSGDCEYLI